MSKRTPTSPTAAYHRLMQAILNTHLDKLKIQPRPEELDKAANVFTKAGGTWEGAFKGSIDDIELLKKVLKAAAKKGVLSKTPKWG